MHITRYIKPYLVPALLLILGTAWAKSNSDWVTYNNAKHGFSIRHPKELQIVSNNFYTSYLLSDHWRIFTDATPSSGELLLSIPVFRLEKTEQYCDYYNIELRVGVSSDLQACSNSNKTVKINGAVFYVYALQDTAMHQSLSGTSYRTIHNGRCLAIEQLETKGPTSKEICPKSRDISKQDLKKSYTVIQKMIRTFRFT